MPAKFLTRAEATDHIRELGIPMGRTALEAWATRGGGPKYVTINGRALYRVRDLLAWVNAQAARPIEVNGRGRARGQRSAQG